MSRPGLVTTLIIVAACCVPEYGHAAHPRKLAPPVICNMANRMTIFVDEDNILWECVCEVMQRGFICRWQVIGGVDPVNTKKRAKPHHRVVRYALPGVVG